MIPCSLCGSAQLQRRAEAVSELLNPQESWFWPNLSSQSEVFLLPLRQICRSQRKSFVREMHHCNWTWNVISLLATKVQVDWGLSLQILISCLGICEHRLSTRLEMMLNPSTWQLKSVLLAPPTVFHYGDIWERARFSQIPLCSIHTVHPLWPLLHYEALIK